MSDHLFPTLTPSSPPSSPAPTTSSIYTTACHLQAYAIHYLQSLSPCYTVMHPWLRLSKTLTSRTAYLLYYGWLVCRYAVWCAVHIGDPLFPVCPPLQRHWWRDPVTCLLAHAITVYTQSPYSTLAHRRILAAIVLWGGYVARLAMMYHGGRWMVDEWKTTLQQPRPYNRHPTLVISPDDTRKSSYSFPSQSAFTLGMCLFAYRRQISRYPFTAFPAFQRITMPYPLDQVWRLLDTSVEAYLKLVGLLLAYTRWYRGLHYVHDMVGSYGMAWAMVQMVG